MVVAASGFKAFEGQFTQVPTLVASAHGIVLEVGPGVGTQLDRFDKTKIEHVYGIELNPAFVPSLLAEVEKSSLQGKYTVISGSVEDAKLLAQHGVAPGTVDSVVCIGTLCSVQNPAATVKWIYELLKPGGSFIFWEHRRSHDFVTRLVQGQCSHLVESEYVPDVGAGFWNPIWRYFMGGCDLRRLNGDAIKNAGAWEQQDSDFGASKSVAQEWSIMPRVEGILTKKKI
jgi:SAM-dependent methyltransferase